LTTRPTAAEALVKELRSRLDDSQRTKAQLAAARDQSEARVAAVEAQQAIPQANRREEGKEELGSARTQDVN
jgi:hypothetical protein